MHVCRSTIGVNTARAANSEVRFGDISVQRLINPTTDKLTKGKFYNAAGSADQATRRL